MNESVKSMAKKKIKKKILGFVLANLPWFFGAAVICTGVSAVISFFQAFFWNGHVIDINNCTIEDTLYAVRDEKLFTNEILDKMMIDRDALQYLVELVYDYNKRGEDRVESRTVEVELMWVCEEEVPIYQYEDILDENGEVVGQQIATKPEYNEYGEVVGETLIEIGTQKMTTTDYRYDTVTVSNNQIISQYEIDWQVLYILCLKKSIQNSPNWECVEVDNEGNIEYHTVFLTKDMIYDVFEDLTYKFHYHFDVYNCGITRFSKEDVMKYPNETVDYYVYEHPKTFHYTGYYPTSKVNYVEGPYYSDYYNYDGNKFVSYERFPNRNRFVLICEKVGYRFSETEFYYLLENVPGGLNVIPKFTSVLKENKQE